MFLAEGIRLAVVAFDSLYPVKHVVCCRELLRSETGQRAAEGLEAAGAEMLEVSADVFRTLSSKQNPQGIAIVSPIREQPLDDVDVSNGLCRIALVQPQDPGNVGAIMRTCDAVGGGALVLLDNSVDAFDPKCVRASMGAIFAATIVRATIAEFNRWSSESGSRIIGVNRVAETSYRNFRYAPPLTLLLGSEREGIPADVEVAANVAIPMVGTGDSLNLAIATSIVLYEVFDQLATGMR